MWYQADLVFLLKNYEKTGGCNLFMAELRLSHYDSIFKGHVHCTVYTRFLISIFFLHQTHTWAPARLSRGALVGFDWRINILLRSLFCELSMSYSHGSCVFVHVWGCAMDLIYIPMSKRIMCRSSGSQLIKSMSNITCQLYKVLGVKRPCVIILTWDHCHVSNGMSPWWSHSIITSHVTWIVFEILPHVFCCCYSTLTGSLDCPALRQRLCHFQSHGRGKQVTKNKIHFTRLRGRSISILFYGI